MPLAFTADENVNKTLVKLLRVSGYSVTHITEVSPGSPDKAVLHHSSSQNAILITTDKHFGELVFRQRRTTSGVLLVRLHALSPTARAHRVGFCRPNSCCRIDGCARGVTHAPNTQKGMSSPCPSKIDSRFPSTAEMFCLSLSSCHTASET